MAGDALLALSVLREVAEEERPLTVRELTERLDANRSSVYRIARDLGSAGWLKAAGSPTGYEPTWDLMTLGVLALARNRVREILFPHAIELSARTGLSSAIAFYHDGEVIWTDRMRVSGSRVSSFLSMERAPATTVASGKILLAHEAPDEVERVSQLPVRQYAERTNVTQESILADIEATRARGYGVSDREFRVDMAGISFAVLDAAGNARAAVGVGVPSASLAELTDLCVRHGREAAEAASAELGYRVDGRESLA